MFRFTHIIEARVERGVASCFTGFRRSRGRLAVICGALGAANRIPVGRKAAAALISGVALASLSAVAVAQGYDPRNLSADQTAPVGQTCETVLRVHPGDAHYDGCVESLSDSLKSVSQAEAGRRARDSCFSKWPERGGADLAECLLDVADGATGSAASVSSKSYFYASANEVHRRERLSCARLGFDPVSGAFASCVANLAGSLAAIDMSPN